MNIFTLLLLLAVFTAGSDTWADAALIAGLGDVDRARLLADLGHSSEARTLASGQTVQIIDFDGTTAVLSGLDCVGDHCRALRLLARYRLPESGLESVNRWNAGAHDDLSHMAKAFLDEDGNANLEADLDLEGGVSDRDLADFVNDFARQAGHFDTALLR